MSYRVALASQVDTGQMTLEVAKYQFQQRIAEYQAEDRAATAAALSQLGGSLQQAGAQMQSQSPVNCNSVGYGNMVTTEALA